MHSSRRLSRAQDSLVQSIAGGAYALLESLGTFSANRYACVDPSIGPARALPGKTKSSKRYTTFPGTCKAREALGRGQRVIIQLEVMGRSCTTPWWQAERPHR